MTGPGDGGAEADEDFGWVRTAETSRLLDLLRTLRDPQIGDDPGHALKILNAIGVLRAAENLVAEARSFQEWDRELILAGAALQRDVAQAAALLIELWHQPDHPGGDDHATARVIGTEIIAEVARQRIAVECTQLIGILLAEAADPEHGRWATSLADLLVQRFALGDGPLPAARAGARQPLAAKRLGRPERDIVLFYAALSGAGHRAQADRLLDLTLRAENRPGAVTRLALEFEHFVPRRDVPARWLARAVGDLQSKDSAIAVATELLAAPDPLPEAVIATIAETWTPKAIVQLCGGLRAGEAVEAILDRVGGGPPMRAAEVLDEWWQKAAPEVGLRLLLDAVTGATRRDPRPLPELRDIAEDLGAWLRTRLLRRAAVGVGNRPGADLVELLWMIEQEKARREAAFEAADCLAQDAEPRVVIDYVSALHARGSAEARRIIDIVRDALTDRWPCRSAVIAEVAAGLWERPETREYGEQLLKQHLRNQRAITGRDVVIVLEKLRRLPEPAMTDAERRQLLHDTVALWSAVHLDDAWTALSADPDPKAPQDREALLTNW
ncbi:MAG: hypothetical protein ACJ786_42410 [Catenulispora sp.]